jgi:hypothetical protein
VTGWFCEKTEKAAQVYFLSINTMHVTVSVKKVARKF